MSIFDTSTLGASDNQITFNGTAYPIYRVVSRAPQKRQLRELDIPIPFEDGVDDFQTLEGSAAYVIEGVMYPGSEIDYDNGIAALRKLASLDIEQADNFADTGYVPYVYTEATQNKQIFLKVLYVDVPETTRKGLVQPFKLVCKIKDPTIFSTATSVASTQAGNPILQQTITNLITNPSFETGTTNCSAYNGSTIAQSSAQAYLGTYSLAATTTSGSNKGVQYGFQAVSASTTYTYSAYVYVTNGQSFSVEVDQYNGGSFVSQTNTSATGTGGWQRVSFSFTTASNITQVLIFIYLNASTTFYVDAHMLQTGSAASSYFDGSSTSNAATTYAWTGTANASTSTASVYILGSSAFPFQFPVLYSASIYAFSSVASNIGDLDGYPTSIKVYGPVNTPTVTNTKTGEYITVSTNVAANSILTIAYDKDSLSVDVDGVSVLNKVSATSTYFKLKPGGNVINLTGQTVNSNSYATVSYYNGYWPLS